jgi:hypothetical protein
MPGLVPPHRPSATPRCPQRRLPVVGTHSAPLPRGQWQPGLGTGCSRDATPMPRTLRAACHLEAGRERASWERRCIPACPVDGVASRAVPAIAPGPPVAACCRVPRWRLVQARIHLGTPGVRDRVLDLSCARQHVRVRLPPWQPPVDAGDTHVGSASRPAIPSAPPGWDQPVIGLACASRCAPLEGGFPYQANGSYHILTGESDT